MFCFINLCKGDYSAFVGFYQLLYFLLCGFLYIGLSFVSPVFMKHRTFALLFSVNWITLYSISSCKLSQLPYFYIQKKRYIYKSKNVNKNMPKNTTKYLVILKECKNIYYIFVDNMKRRIYNKNSYGRDEL